MTKSELQTLRDTAQRKIDAQRAEYREWERKCEQDIKRPLVVCELSYEQWREWVRGMYNHGKPFDWM